MNNTSGFDQSRSQEFDNAELLNAEGATCQAFRVRRYGKWHFLKRLKPEFALDPRYVAAMEKEFETAYRLEHPSLPRYIERGDDYILMEYIDGWTLTDYLEQQPEAFQNEKRLHTFCWQLLQALQYLHAHQVLHLDLKPDNILITRIGQEVRLVDLGCCYTDSNPFTTGHTDPFAAPEQKRTDAEQQRFTPATDLYAFGRILEYMSASKPLPPRYQEVMHRCLAERPHDRFQSAQEVMDALAHKTSRTKTIVAVLLLPLLIAIVLWWFFSGLQQSNTTTPAIQPATADSLASSPTPANPDTTSSPEPINAQENYPAPISQSPQQPKETPQPPPLKQQIVGNISYLEQEIKKPIPSPSKGEYPELDAAIIAACEPVFQSTVDTFRDSLYSESASVMRNWTMAMKNCKKQLPPIERELQLQFSGQVSSQEVTHYLNDYVSSKFNRIVLHMLLNAYRQGYRH